MTEKEILNQERNKKREFIINPLVSVRIPTLNRSQILLERAIPSALGQSYKNIEVIIVGDHCIDDTEEKVEEINTNTYVRWHNLSKRTKEEKELLKNPEIRWFMGPVRATNKATDLCSGEWIAHLDDDDFWTTTHIENLLRFAQRWDYEMVYADYVEVRYGKEKVVENSPSTWLIRDYVAKTFKLDDNCWKKEKDKVSDIDVFKRMEKAGVKIGYLKEIVAYVIPRPGEETIGHEAYLKYNPHGNSL